MSTYRITVLVKAGLARLKCFLQLTDIHYIIDTVSTK